MDKEKNFASAVVYCHNDAVTIGKFVESLDHTLNENFLKYEIIIVDDDSHDDSVQIIRNFASHKEGKVITVLNMSHYQGLEASMNAGVDLSIGDFVYEFDYAVSDFDRSLVMDIYRHSLKGYDIVSARSNRRISFSARIFYAVFNRYANLQHKIGSETFRILSRRAINRVRSITQSVPFRKAAYANCGLTIDCIEYQSDKTMKRKNPSACRDVTFDSLLLFTDVAYKITMGLAAVMAFIVTVFAFFALFYKLTRNPVEGWTTTIIFISLGFFGLFIIMAMVIKYLQTLVTLVFHKKTYIFKSIEKLQ